MNGFVLFWKYTHVRLFLFLSSGLGGSSKALIKVIITIDNDDDDDDDDDNDEQQIEIQNSEVNEMNGKILYKKIEYDITCNTYPCTCHKLEGISIHYQLLEYKIL